MAQTVLPEVLPITEAGIMPYIIGVPIYTMGVTLALLGRVQLGDNWMDIEHARVDENQELVSTGIYRYVRHPIYAGDLLLLVGLELALNSWLVLATAALGPIIYRQALREEAMLANTFAAYETYANRTKRFVPFLV
jgi:protein-S-isoprenylcysteine O-methyltransferase Ste14